MTYRSTDAREIKKAEEWLRKYWDRPIKVEYYHARSINEAVGLLHEYGKAAKIIAGGTDLLGLMKNRVVSPQVFVNLKNIPNLRYIQDNEKGLAIGTLTLINDLQRSTILKSKYPILYETACAIASPQIRNMATVGGNLCQDVRCWYYRRSPDTGITYNCGRKIETGQCYAADGENQYHAVMGRQKCCAICGSDMATALLALDARVDTVSVTGGRSLEIDKLYTPLGNILEPDEVITNLQVPAATDTRQHFMKFRIRKTIDFAIVSAAVVINLENEVVRDARIVLGGVAYKPWRAFKAEELLKGERITEKLAAEAGKVALTEAKPLSKNGYKADIAKIMVKRAILGED